MISYWILRPLRGGCGWEADPPTLPSITSRDFEHPGRSGYLLGDYGFRAQQHGWFHLNKE